MNSQTLPKSLLDKIQKRYEKSFHFRALNGDASSKSFFCSESENKEILMIMKDHKEGRGSLADWIKIQSLLKQNEIRVPEVLESFPEENALLLENCGEKTLQQFFSKTENLPLYEKVQRSTLSVLKKMRKIPKEPLHLKLDKKELQKDRNLFLEAHLEPRVKFLPSFKKDLFLRECNSLESFLLKTKQYFTHRDFHSGNLLLKEKELYLIDFQDACWASSSYDFVSLVFDPYIPLSIVQRKTSFENALHFFLDDFEKEEKELFLDTLRAQTIQRLYKILGSYNYLSLKLKKSKFFSFIKPVLEILESFDFYDPRWPYLTSQLAKELRSAEEKKEQA